MVKDRRVEMFFYINHEKIPQKRVEEVRFSPYSSQMKSQRTSQMTEPMFLRKVLKALYSLQEFLPMGIFNTKIFSHAFDLNFFCWHFISFDRMSVVARHICLISGRHLISFDIEDFSSFIHHNYIPQLITSRQINVSIILFYTILHS